MSALNTVRSAPVSNKKGALTHKPSRVWISPRITGRITPSSHTCHVPLSSINPRYVFLGNQACETAIIVRMGRDSQSQSLFGGVSDKQLCTSNTNALATVRSVDLGG